MEKNNKIAVIGGTGKAGKFLVKELVNQGFSIKILLRNSDKLKISSPLKKVGDVADFVTVYSIQMQCWY